MVKTWMPVVLAGIALAGLPDGAGAEPNAPAVYTTAVFPFAERGNGVAGYGEKVSDILFASLAANPNLHLVDRKDLKKALEEAELGLSGMVAGGQATKIGQLTGAKVLVTGSVVEADKTLYLIAKIIGTETSRVFGASVKGRASDELGPLAEGLAAEVAKTVTEKAGTLVAQDIQAEDRIAALKKALGAAKRPTVLIRIAERHVGQATLDPAAAIELARICKETGFDVLDPKAGSGKADIVLEGEGFSEFAMRRGNIVCVKARLEVKAVDRQSDKIVAAERQVDVEVDLAEQIAGKKALQKAAAAIAERLLPKLVTK
jgi:TolB-like protein